MGAIVSDFGSLPEHDQPDWLANYQACFQQLGEMGLSVPPTTPENTTRADLLLCLQEHAGAAIKAEIENDPAEVGYLGKNTAEATDLLQSSQPVPNWSGPSRLSTIWTGLPFTPNFIVEADTIGALT